LIAYQMNKKKHQLISICWMVLYTNLYTIIFLLTYNIVICLLMAMATWTPERIKELRKRFNLSQPALGKMVGVSGVYIYMLEGGDRSPSKTLCLLLDRIEVELAAEIN